MRQVKQIYGARPTHWVGDGFQVQPLFSHGDGRIDTDPFLMLDYAAPMEFKPNTAHPRGVGQHPHKGFETVTIACQGEVAHRDSSGGGGIIREGDVQWMTAGNGIIHEEFHSPAFSERGGQFEMVQLWVNLPAIHKTTPAGYQHLANAEIPVIDLPDQAGTVRLIAGELDGRAGAAKTFSPINVWEVELQADAETSLSVPENHNLLMVVLRGEVRLNHQQEAKEGNLVTFENGSGSVALEATHGKAAKLLLLSGVPIREPIAAYGPFVMNTDAEIRQAIHDFNAGKFGLIGG